MIFTRKNKDRHFHDRLANPDYYLRAIVRLHRKFHSGNSGKIYNASPEGYNLMQAFMDRHALARSLAHDVSRGIYQFSPARINHIPTADKVRKVFAFTLPDQIVNTAIYLMLAPEMLPYVSEHVHSYMKGRSRITAINSFMAHLREHRGMRPDKKTRGLFVLRSDIKSYGESISVAPDAPVWTIVRQWFLSRFGAMPGDIEWKILSRCIRPCITDSDGNTYDNLMGIPDGAPISALLLNLYAKPLDDALSGIPGSFYIRFGDDFLFSHPNLGQFTQALASMHSALAGLKLQHNESKTYHVFLNGAARPSGDVKGAAYVEYLGCQLHFNGAVGLKNEKIRMLLQDLRARASATMNAAAGETTDTQGELLGSIINQALTPHTMFANPQALFLRQLVSDRAQLRALDKHIARIMLHALTGNPSIKQFRKIPYRKIRTRWAVESLEYGRN